jgi:hypothetical protein
MLKKIKIKDKNFAHVNYSSDFQISKYFEWDRNVSNISEEICFVTDDYLSDPVENTNFVAWVLEPRGTNPYQYNFMKGNFNQFKYVLTYDKELLETNEKFVFYPHGGCWIRPGEEGVHEKNKLVSMISSTKSNHAPGYLVRAEIREKFKDKFDSYGRGHNTINLKIDGLKDYMFSIAIENSKFDYYFSEKLIDCFMTGTIPIYWGCPAISDFFNIDGILSFDNIEEFEGILNQLTPELYSKKLESIKDNFERAKKYILSEDWIYENTKILK